MGSQEHFEGRNPCIAIRKHKLKLPIVVFPAREEHFESAVENVIIHSESYVTSSEPGNSSL